MKRILFILLIAVPFFANGQNQTIDPTVEVNRQFQGKIMELAKGKLNTTLADSLNIFNVDFNYSFFNRQYKDLYEFSPLPSVSTSNEKAHEYKFMAKGGIGVPLSPEAAIWYTPVKGEKDFLSIAGEWNMFSKKQYKEQNYGAKGNYTHIFKWGEAALSAAFGGGSNKIGSEGGTFSHNFYQLSAAGKLKPFEARQTGRKFNWELGGSYKRTRDKSSASLSENYGKFEGYFGPTFGRYSQLSVNVSASGVDYDTAADFWYGLIDITPQYKFERGDMTVNLGVTLSGKFISNKEAEVDKYHNFISPAVKLTFSLLKERLWLYGVLDGKNHLNAWSSILQENRYINPAYSPANLFAGSTPLNAEMGLKGRATDKFTYSIYARYAVHKGMLQYAYFEDGGWYNTFNSNHNEFGAGAEFTAKMENFIIGGEFCYTSFSKGKNSTFADGLYACGKPKLSGKVEAMYNWKGGISAGLACKAWGSFYAALWSGQQVEEVGGNADIDINVQYAVSPLLSVYLKGENILGSPSVNHPFTIGRGGCIIGGIIVKL